MELINFINSRQYKGSLELLPTFSTSFLLFERKKGPIFISGVADAKNFTRGNPNVQVRIEDSEFEHIKDGQDIRIIYTGFSEEECYILRGVRDIKKDSSSVCSYTLKASPHIWEAWKDDYFYGNTKVY